MNKVLFSSLVVLSIAGAAFAGPPKKVAKAKLTIACPVMTDHMVNIKEATAAKKYVDYKGRRYFMCCGGCGPAFTANPAKYAKAASIAVPGKKKHG